MRLPSLLLLSPLLLDPAPAGPPPRFPGAEAVPAPVQDPEAGEDPGEDPADALRRAQEDEVLGYHLAETEHFVCLTHWHSERNREGLAADAAALCEATLAQVAALGADARPTLAQQVVVELHRGRKQYVNAVSGFLGEAAREDWAWSEVEQGVVHVTVAPIQPDRAAEMIGIPPRTLERLAEEVARLALLRAAPVLARPDQAWLRSGLVQAAAMRALQERGKGHAGLASPGWSTAVAGLQAAARAGELPTPAELAAGSWADHERRPALERAVAEWLLQGEAGDGARRALAARLAAPADAVPGEDALAAWLADPAGVAFEPWLQALEPVWDEWSPALYETAYGWIQTPWRGDSGVCFRREPVGTDTYRIEGEVMLLPGPKGMAQMNLLLALRDDGSYISIAITGKDGVTIFEYDPEQDTFKGLARNLRVPVRPYDVTRFLVEVRDGRLFVVVNGVSVQQVEVTGRDMSGPWGVGAQRESSGVWLEVHQE